MEGNGVGKFNPIDELTKIGKIGGSSAYDTEADIAAAPGPHFTSHYKVFDVTDQTDNVSLCATKDNILNKNWHYSEETNFTKEGNYLVALMWYEET